MPQEAPTQDKYDEACAYAVRVSMEEYWKEADPEKLKRSTCMMAMETLVQDAKEYAISTGMIISGFDENKDTNFEIFIRSELFYFCHLCDKTGVFRPENEYMDFYWMENITPITFDVVSGHKLPSMDRSGVTLSARDYLVRTFRYPVMDRKLLLALICLTFDSYASEITTYYDIPGYPKTPAKKTTPFNIWFKHLGGDTLLFMGLGVLFSLLNFIHLFPTAWLPATLLIFGLLALWSFCVATARLLTNRPRFAKEKAKATDILDKIRRVYIAANSMGPISPRHIEYLARAATDVTVNWPDPLFALLDDMTKRGAGL